MDAKISVIVPLYNAEKYIAECLDSLLAQTFTAFEVIIVDDCSTDSSAAIVESYREKFGGRLTFTRLKKNSGNAGYSARNRGFNCSRGEYVFFVDADDTLTKTALEELYTLAKDFDADVVYCEKYFMSSGMGQDFKKNIHPADFKIQKPPFVNEPLFEPENLSERIKNILSERFWVTPWLKLVRRNLLIENRLFFPNLTISDDDIWTYGLIFCAKKFLRVPNAVYIRRMREDSLSFIKRTPQQKINFWLNPILFGLKLLDTFMSRHEFFRRNPQFRYAVLDAFVAGRFGAIFEGAAQLQPFEVYEAIKHEFGDRLGEHDVLLCALCTALNTQQKINVINRQQFNQFAAQAQARIAQLEAEVKRLQL